MLVFQFVMSVGITEDIMGILIIVVTTVCEGILTVVVGVVYVCVI